MPLEKKRRASILAASQSGPSWLVARVYNSDDDVSAVLKKEHTSHLVTPSVGAQASDLRGDPPSRLRRSLAGNLVCRHVRDSGRWTRHPSPFSLSYDPGPFTSDI